MTEAKPCARPGCTAPAERTYCSRRCANLVQGQRRGSAFYQALSAKGNKTRTGRGRATLIYAHELRLMTTGRYHEAARVLLDRGYGAGWLAGRTGARLQDRKLIA